VAALIMLVPSLAASAVIGSAGGRSGKSSGRAHEIEAGKHVAGKLGEGVSQTGS
jgi:hypothetical protein